MYKVLYMILTIFWILDICNLPFMEMFDTTYPINDWVWLLIWMFIPNIETIAKYKNEED